MHKTFALVAFALLPFTACKSAEAPPAPVAEHEAPDSVPAMSMSGTATEPETVPMTKLEPAVAKVPATAAVQGSSLGKPTGAKSNTVYDEQAVGTEQIAQALARAKKENRRVLVQWGANWCGWCIKLHGLMNSDAKIAHELSYEYDVVKIDIGQWDKHMDLAASYGAELKKHGVPYLTVLDADGKVLANQETSSLENKSETKAENAPGHDPAQVLAFLTQHQAPYANAQDIYDAALARANSEKKRVFLHFGAPWCGWCHKLENWMAEPAIAALLAKDYIEVKIDTDRTNGGKDLLAKMRVKEEGIPWFAMLDASGAVLADSSGPKGNIGFPAATEEIAYFKSMLERTHVNLSPADIAKLEASLAPKK